MEELRSILKYEATPTPVSPDPRAQDHKLKLGYNTTYIVAGVLFEGDKVLLIQEAKPSCRGQWYLPAGRMEPNETIVEAVKREVLEESGMTFEPEAVIAVECMSRMWVRVTMAGRVTGGSLKTPAQADKESIQAGWFNKVELSLARLRANDILRLVDTGRKWREGKRYGGLPALVGHVSSSLRLIMATQDKSQLLVLVRSQSHGSTLFPSVEVGYGNIGGMVEECGCQATHQIRGVLSIEHSGRPHGVYDGICVSVLVEVSSPELTSSSQYQWATPDQAIQLPLLEALENCAQLNFF